MTTNDLSKSKAEQLFKKVDTFILSCVDEGGYPLTKAVVPGKYRDSMGEMYFCTNTSSRFAASVASSPKASVYFYSKGLFWQGCMLKGLMEIVQDAKVKERYWQNAFKNAYPEKSYTDPDFCVLKFTPTSGRFYSNYQPIDFEI